MTTKEPQGELKTFVTTRKQPEDLGSKKENERSARASYRVDVYI